MDHRSYKRQGVEQIPTVHLGALASGLEKRGIQTELGDKNRAIAETNKKLRQINARLKKLDAYKFDVLNSPPTLYEVFSEMYRTPPEKRSQKWHVTNVQSMSQTMLFFDKYNIETVSVMTRVVSEMRGKFNTVSENLKKTERRLETLGEHIKQSENFKEFRSFKRGYDKLEADYEAAKKETGFFAGRKIQKAKDVMDSYYERYRRELTLFAAAERYLKGVMQSRYDPKKLPPITTWKNELAEKTGERATLYRDYEKLKSKTQKVEQIKRTVEQMLKSQKPEQERTQTKKSRYDQRL